MTTRATSTGIARIRVAPLDDANVIPLPPARIERRQAVAGLIHEYHRAS